MGYARSWQVGVQGPGGVDLRCGKRARHIVSPKSFERVVCRFPPPLLNTYRTALF